ncbi:MAG: TIGR00282 family metallophosphoesterase [Desulfuromonas sp.]|nr:MAG: TIGR00282 family metallophosphoesterase [Desulfuromonas sp.]
MKILFIGDIVGKPGRFALRERLGRLIDRHAIDLTIANCENAAAGFGLTVDVAEELFGYGVDVMTSGNHIWDKRDILDFLDAESRILRPANYPGEVPGRGAGSFKTNTGISVGVINLEGRVFMNDLDCPFQTVDRLIEEMAENDFLFVDMHAEATSEKMALGWYLDGRVAAVVGTHTHVQTADERILPGGTAFISDVGMTGSRDGVIGMRREPIIEKFLTQRPIRFEVAKKEPVLCAVVIDVDETTGAARQIERVMELVD